MFAGIGRVEEKITEVLPSPDQATVKDKDRELAKLLCRPNQPDKVENAEVFDPMADLSLNLAPHITLNQKLRETADAENTPIAVVNGILRLAKLVELLSFGRIAENRHTVIVRERVNNLIIRYCRSVPKRLARLRGYQ